MKISEKSRGGVCEQRERPSFGSPGGSPQGDWRGSRRAARRPRSLVGQAQDGGGAPAATRGRHRTPLPRTGRDCGNALRLAGAVADRHGSEPESAGSRCRERRDPAAEIVGCRSEHEQRAAAGENSPYRGRAPFGLAEVEAMRHATSPFAERRYGVVRVMREWKMARSSFYYQLHVVAQPERTLRRRGPKTAWSDAALLGKIRDVLAVSPFYGEGHRKVWARLRFEEVRTSKARVLRLMREAQLLAPSRALPKPENPHTGTLITARPNEVWASDHTLTVTIEEGQVTVFVAVDHCTTECVGLHAAKKATRFEALEPLRQGVRNYCGGFRAGAAAGIRNRHDHGSQYMSDDYQAEIAFLGDRESPSFVRQPECNGCVERFIRTLKEQLLWVKVFQNIEALRCALAEFRERYNQRWIVQRLGYLTPAQARQQLLALGAAA